MAATERLIHPETETKRWMIWAGRVATAIPSLMLLFSASLKLSHAPSFVPMFTDHLGFKESALTPIGILEVLVTALYLVPRTAALGAVLLTGYLGGAIVSHVRIGDPFGAPLVLGILVWAGLYLRDARVRQLLPLR